MDAVGVVVMHSLVAVVDILVEAVGILVELADRFGEMVDRHVDKLVNLQAEDQDCYRVAEHLRKGECEGV